MGGERGPRLIFARHGESEANLSRTFANHGDGWPLTKRGRSEAQALAGLLAREGVTGLWSSPILRAMQTSDFIARTTRLAVQPAEALREFDVGHWEGTASDAGWREYDEVMAAWRRGHHDRRVGGGESLLDIRARLEPFLRDVIDAAGPDDAVAFIGHGGVYRSVLPLLLDNVSPAFGLELPMATTAVIAVEVVAGRLTCRRWCDVVFDAASP